MSRTQRRKADTSEEAVRSATSAKQATAALQILVDTFSNEEYEVPCRPMLLAFLKTALYTPLPDDLSNKSWKTSVIDGMIGKTLTQISEKLDSNAKDLSHKVENADDIKNDLEKLVQKCTEEIDALQPRMQACLEECEALQATLAKATEANDAALEERKKEVEQHETNLRLQELITKCQAAFEKVNDTVMSSKDVRRAILPIEQLFSELNCGLAIANALPEAFVVPPDERHEFDILTINFVKRQLEVECTRVNESISSYDSRVAALDALSATTQEALSAANDAVTKQNNTYDQHEAEEKRLIATKKDSEKRIKNHDKNVNQWKKGAEESKEAVENFQSSVLPSFEFLKERTPESMGA